MNNEFLIVCYLTKQINKIKNVRGLPSGCQEDASAVRRIARKMTEWSASYNIPCGDRAGEEPVYHNKLAQKIKKWRQKLIRRACKEFKDQE